MECKRGGGRDGLVPLLLDLVSDTLRCLFALSCDLVVHFYGSSINLHIYRPRPLITYVHIACAYTIEIPFLSSLFKKSVLRFLAFFFWVMKSSNEFESVHVHQVYEQIAADFSRTRHKPWPLITNFISNLPLVRLLRSLVNPL